MLTDVQIAQSAQMQPIKEIAAKVGLSDKKDVKAFLEKLNMVVNNKKFNIDE